MTTGVFIFRSHLILQIMYQSITMIPTGENSIYRMTGLLKGISVKTTLQEQAEAHYPAVLAGIVKHSRHRQK